jgi:SAM-dependent methyltransferase
VSSTQLLQESIYAEGVDYRRGSPHLAHWPLYDRLTGILRDEVRHLAGRGLALDVLEVGAGHGGYTEPALAAGCRVTAVEMSRPALAQLDRRFGTNSDFSSVFDPDGSLSEVGGGFSLVLCVSVLHHMPDYLTFLDCVTDKLRPGGSLLALQDPLWYPRAGRGVRVADRVAFYAWRLGQGDLREGFGTLGRRLRGGYDETNPSDMVEYHVVRQGVDERAVAGLLAGRFGSIEVLPYWSNQWGVAQRLGERLGLHNTFGVLARARADSARPLLGSPVPAVDRRDDGRGVH